MDESKMPFPCVQKLPDTIYAGVEGGSPNIAIIRALAGTNKIISEQQALCRIYLYSLYIQTEAPCYDDQKIIPITPLSEVANLVTSEKIKHNYIQNYWDMAKKDEYLNTRYAFLENPKRLLKHYHHSRLTDPLDIPFMKLAENPKFAEINMSGSTPYLINKLQSNLEQLDTELQTHNVASTTKITSNIFEKNLKKTAQLNERLGFEQIQKTLSYSDSRLDAMCFENHYYIHRLIKNRILIQIHSPIAHKLKRNLESIKLTITDALEDYFTTKKNEILSIISPESTKMFADTVITLHPTKSFAYADTSLWVDKPQFSGLTKELQKITQQYKNRLGTNDFKSKSLKIG